MRPNRDLDSAIDLVAKRLTRVEDDPLLASRIVASLPERATWLGWWMPRLAGLAVLFVVAASSMLLINRQPAPVTPVLLPASSVALLAAPLAVPEPLALGTKPLEPLEPLELLEPLDPLELKADHEFSLPSLDVEALPPLDLSTVAPIEISPLTIVELPLSSEFPERY